MTDFPPAYGGKEPPPRATAGRPRARTVPARYRDRARYDRGTIDAILDEALVAHLGFVVDGAPRVLPTLHVRVGDVLYLHGSTGSTPMLGAGGNGLDVCVTVTLLDGLVLARSAFHHSASYRSVIVHGRARMVSDEDEKRRALAAFLDHVAAGRAADCRPPSRAELAATAVLALPLTEASAKVRDGSVADDARDLQLPHWAGLLPLRMTAGAPEPAGDSHAEVPGYLSEYGRRAG